MPAPTHRRPAWWRRAAMLLAHTQPAVLALVIVADIVRQRTASVALTIAHGGIVAAAALALLAEHYHEHRLCPRCAAATGGPATAQRRHRWLRLHHWATERIGYVLIFFGLGVAFALGYPNRVAYPVYALWALVAYANLVHRPVQPWCPHCRGWGGDDDTEPVPPPVPAAGATC